MSEPKQCQNELDECPICMTEFCPVNSVDENGDWDGSQKQNCSCQIYLWEQLEAANKKIKCIEHSLEAALAICKVKGEHDDARS